MLIDGIIVSLREKVLCSLHSAHQGMDGMNAHAYDSIYWSVSIWNFRANYSVCATIAPNQPWEPITIPGMGIPTNSNGHILILGTLHTSPVWID